MHNAEDFQFRYRDIKDRNRTYTQRRVAYSVSQPKGPGTYMVVSFQIGWEVLKVLGWEGGYDRVQIAEKRGWLAMSRQCGQFKLSKTTESGQAVLSMSARRFEQQPQETCGVTELEFSILERKDGSGEKVLVFKSPF